MSSKDPFGFDSGHGFAEDGKPEVEDFLFQIGEDPFGAGHHQAMLARERFLHGLRISANDGLIHGKKCMNCKMPKYKFQNIKSCL